MVAKSLEGVIINITLTKFQSAFPEGVGHQFFNGVGQMLRHCYQIGPKFSKLVCSKVSLTLLSGGRYCIPTRYLCIIIHSTNLRARGIISAWTQRNHLSLDFIVIVLVLELYCKTRPQSLATIPPPILKGPPCLQTCFFYIFSLLTLERDSPIPTPRLFCYG